MADQFEAEPLSKLSSNSGPRSCTTLPIEGTPSELSANIK